MGSLLRRTSETRGNDMLLQCLSCTVCPIQNRFAPPILSLGNFMSDILILGQTPPELDTANDAFMLRVAEINDQYKAGQITAQDVEATFRYEFIHTPYGQQLLDVFGTDMFDNYVLSWAVRCRISTKPEPDMTSACSAWTTTLLRRRKGVITIGGLAKSQVLGDNAGSIEFGQIRKNAPFFTIMALKPASLWNDNDKADYRTMLGSLLADLSKPPVKS